jgi:nucleoside-diphosphate-sugar epimerase
MKRALITGSDGFIGRHLRGALDSDEWDVVALDLPYGNILDWLKHKVPGFDLVVHCAAVVGGRETIERDALRLATANLKLDAMFFDWVQRSRPEHAVYISSSAVYPVDLQMGGMPVFPSRGLRVGPSGRLHEDAVNFKSRVVGMPDNTYGWVKLTGERLAYEANADDMRVHVVRPFSGYGSDQDDVYPFPAFIDRALRDDDPFIVWGNGYQVRDWVHVDDVVNAILAVYEHDVRNPVNICTGIGTSMDDLARLVMSCNGHGTRIEHRVDQPSGVHYRVGDASRLNEFYTCRVTIENGIEQALKERAM